MLYTGNRQTILEILSFREYLTARKMSNYLTKKYNKNISYQAVYKLLNEMTHEGILIKQDKLYSISSNWIDSLGGLVYRLKNLKDKRNNIKDLIANLELFNFPIQLQVGSVSDINLIADEIVRRFSHTIICTECKHLWYVLTARELEWVGHNAIKGNVYTICRENTVVDIWCAEFERHLGINILTNVDCALDCHTFAFEDYVIQILYPKEFLESITILYSSFRNMNNPGERLKLVNSLKELFSKEFNITMLINKNKEMAQCIKERIVSCFLENKLLS